MTILPWQNLTTKTETVFYLMLAALFSADYQNSLHLDKLPFAIQSFWTFEIQKLWMQSSGVTLFCALAVIGCIVEVCLFSSKWIRALIFIFLLFHLGARYSVSKRNYDLFMWLYGSFAFIFMNSKLPRRTFILEALTVYCFACYFGSGISKLFNLILNIPQDKETVLANFINNLLAEGRLLGSDFPIQAIQFLSQHVFLSSLLGMGLVVFQLLFFIPIFYPSYRQLFVVAAVAFHFAGKIAVNVNFSYQSYFMILLVFVFPYLEAFNAHIEKCKMKMMDKPHA